MEINDVIWLDDIVANIETKHGIGTWEVEEVLERNQVLAIVNGEQNIPGGAR